MQHRKSTFALAMAAGAAVAIAAGSPAQAAPVIKPPIKNILPADLRLDSLEVIQLGGVLSGAWQVKATLRNYVASYPGGGKLVLRRTTGGTIPNEPPILIGPAVADPGKVLAEKPVPAMAVGQTLTVQAVSRERGIFEAFVVPPGGDPDGDTPAFQESPHTNNSRSANILKPRDFWLDTGWLETNLNGLTSQLKLRLDRNDSFAKLGDVYDSHWKAAGVPSPLAGTDWQVHDINYQNALEIAGTDSLVLVMGFESDGPELQGPYLPNMNANPIKVKAEMPLSFNAPFQFFFCSDQPKVTVEAKLSGLPAGMTNVQNTFESRLADAVREVFAHEKIQERLEYELNHQVREKMLNNKGRIVGVDFNGSIKIHAEIGD